MYYRLNVAIGMSLCYIQRQAQKLGKNCTAYMHFPTYVLERVLTASHKDVSKVAIHKRFLVIYRLNVPIGMPLCYIQRQVQGLGLHCKAYLHFPTYVPERVLTAFRKHVSKS